VRQGSVAWRLRLVKGGVAFEFSRCIAIYGGCIANLTVASSRTHPNTKLPRGVQAVYPYRSK